MQARAIRTIPSRNTDVNEPLLTVRDAAEQLRVSPSWLYQNREIPSVKLGRSRRWRPRDTAAYVEAHTSHDISTEAI